MPRRDAEGRELGAGGRDLDVGLRVDALTALAVCLEQPVVLQLLDEARVDRRALTELSEAHHVVLLAEADRPAPLALLAARLGELLTDHAQREKLVALQPQDQLQALHVLLAEQPVAAACALRRQQPLILEVADL